MPKLKYSLEEQCRQARLRQLKRKGRYSQYPFAWKLIKLVMEELRGTPDRLWQEAGQADKYSGNE